MLKSLLPLLPLLLLTATGCQAPEPAGAISLSGERWEPRGPHLSVMSFNIRYGTARDGAHNWPARRELVAARIDAEQPDILAIQEALDFQLAELAGVLDGYTKVGVHRDGGEAGEFSGLYLKQASIELLDSGQFWLSETPEIVGSVSWDAALTRTATWAEVQHQEGGGAFRVYGTHYDHRGERARLESSRLILRDAVNRPMVLVLGDLNATENEPPLLAFFAEGYHSAMRELHPQDERGTFNGFQDPFGGRRIDHILYRGLEPLDAAILGGKIGELFPSDHDAVVARFQLP